MTVPGVRRVDQLDGSYAYLVGETVVMLSKPSRDGSWFVRLIGMDGHSHQMHVQSTVSISSVWLPAMVAALKVPVA